VGVLTREDQPAGRGQHLEESPVKRVARANGLPVQQPRSLRSEEAQAALAALQPDLFVVAAYGLLLPQTVLDLPHFGCLNVHGSLLPRHRGASPITAAILAGDVETGVSLMCMDAGLDTGPVIAQASIPITATDTTGTLTAKLAELGADLLLTTLPRYVEGEITPQPQVDEHATFAPRINKDAGEIDWSQPAEQIQRQVQAYQPWPSAFTSWRRLRLKVISAHADPAATSDRAPGDVVGDRQRAGVITGQGTLWLHEVQLAGKRVLPIDAFMRGAAGFVGGRLPS
jgi:methionyl-tRNA formyltransferase